MPKRKRYNLSIDSIHDSKIGIKYNLDNKLVDLLNNLDRRVNWFKTLVNSIYGLQAKNNRLKEELANRPTIEDLYPSQMIKLANQDKISFTIEWLNKVKEEFINEKWDLYDTPDLLEQVRELRNNQIKFIDNQIKQLGGINESFKNW